MRSRRFRKSRVRRSMKVVVEDRRTRQGLITAIRYMKKLSKELALVARDAEQLSRKPDWDERERREAEDFALDLHDIIREML